MNYSIFYEIFEQNAIKIWSVQKKAVPLQHLRVSPTRPAHSELPHVLTEARVRGCSGAM